MSLAVDCYELGPLGTNCYVVRASRGAPEAVVVDPGGDAARLRLELARMGSRAAGRQANRVAWQSFADRSRWEAARFQPRL